MDKTKIECLGTYKTNYWIMKTEKGVSVVKVRLVVTFRRRKGALITLGRIPSLLVAGSSSLAAEREPYSNYADNSVSYTFILCGFLCLIL